MKDWINWFRHASPYINRHRNRCMVFAISGEAIEHKNFLNVIHDLSLLSSLGIRIVVVLGARPQIDQALRNREINSSFSGHYRITSKDALPCVLEAYGKVRSEVEALLSIGIVNSPMHGSSIKVVSGNFIVAKPRGVIDGVDFGWTGQVRRVDHESMQAHLKAGSLIIQTAHGYAVTGEIFNLSYDDLAMEIAKSLDADKLIYLGQPKSSLSDSRGEVVRQVDALSLAHLMSTDSLLENNRLLHLASKACNAGVKRVHMLGFAEDGAILEELFTRDGVGTMVSKESYDELRPARLDDLNGIQELIQPLEEQGILVRRSRELLETELHAFTVNVRDNAIIACAALYPYPQYESAELACFAVDPHYRREGRGDRILEEVGRLAKSLGLKYLFVLTTQTEHWFLERGFELSGHDALPSGKAYNTARNSKVLRKVL